MNYSDKLHSSLDLIMHLQHRIITSLINMANAEVNREKINPLEEGLLVKEFEKLQEYYHKLRECMDEYKMEEFCNSVNHYELGSVGMIKKSIEAKRDDNCILNLRDEMVNYIREAYYNMQFVDNDETGIPSIYENEESKSLRDMEYEAYKINITAIEAKDDLDYIESEIIPYTYIAVIIDELAQTESYEKSYSKISGLVNLIDDSEKFKTLNKKEKDEIRKKLIYRKYEEKFKMLNQKYNGVLTDEVLLARRVQSAIKVNSLPLFLGISSTDYSKRYNCIVNEYMHDIKADAKDILLECTKKTESPKVTAQDKMKKSFEKVTKTGKELVKKALMTGLEDETR